MTNLLYIISRLLVLFISDNYWATMVATAVGSSFFPVGIRVGYSLSTK